MQSTYVDVFFYGLFMDTSLLAAKGIHAANSAVARVDGYGLRIGERATLVPDRASKAHGVVMTLNAADLAALYADKSVADYRPETVAAVLQDGTVKTVQCYNLPPGKLAGTNADYAASLLKLAQSLGLPSDYQAEIQSFIE
ncbi:MAG: gamma-glutamylcyclotransferase family protein [Pseudomonadota bacterium]